MTNRDHSVDRHHVTGYFPGNQSIAERLGKAKSFSDISYNVLFRQLTFSELLCSAISTNHNVLASPSVVQEMKPFLDHLYRCLGYLSTKSSSQRYGKKAKWLQDICDIQRNIFGILNARVPEETTLSGEISKYLQARRMHLSPDEDWHRKSGVVREDTSVADAELVAYALAESVVRDETHKPIAIVTGDIDVVNLVRNCFREVALARIPKALEDLVGKSPIQVYFPNDPSWSKDLSVHQVWPEEVLAVQ